MRGRAPHVLAGMTGLVVLAGGLLWWQSTGEDTGAESCTVASALARDAGDQLLPVAELLPAGSVGQERRPLVEETDRVLRALGYGGVRAGRFHETAAEVPALVPVDAAVPEHVLLAAPGSGGGQMLASVRLPDGTATWGRSFDAALRGGGLVGEHLVVVSGDAPVGVLALDPADGREGGCLTLSTSGGEGPVLAEQAGEEIVVATTSAVGVTVHAVDPATAEVSWSQRTAALTDAASLTVVPDEAGAVVVMGRTPADPVLLADLAAGGADPGPSLEALALVGGEGVWTWPEHGGAAAVVGADDGVLVALVANGADRSRFSLVALDTAGQEVWRTTLARQPVGVELWGDTVVLRGASRRGRLELRALSVSTGADRWRLTTPAGEGGLGTGTALGDRYVVPASDGLLVVDPATGDHRFVRTDLVVDQLLPVGDLLLVRSGAALLVSDPV